MTVFIKSERDQGRYEEHMGVLFLKYLWKLKIVSSLCSIFSIFSTWLGYLSYRFWNAFPLKIFTHIFNYNIMFFSFALSYNHLFHILHWANCYGGPLLSSLCCFAFHCIIVVTGGFLNHHYAHSYISVSFL